MAMLVITRGYILLCLSLSLYIHTRSKNYKSLLLMAISCYIVPLRPWFLWNISHMAYVCVYIYIYLYIPYAPCTVYVSYIWVIFKAHVGKYSIHGTYGYVYNYNIYIYILYIYRETYTVHVNLKWTTQYINLLTNQFLNWMIQKVFGHLHGFFRGRTVRNPTLTLFLSRGCDKP